MTVRECLAELGFSESSPGWWRHQSSVAVHPKRGEMLFDSLPDRATNSGGACVEFPGCRRVFDLLHLLQLLGAKVPGSLDQFTENTTVDEARAIMDQHKLWWLDLGNLPLCEKDV